MAGKGQKIGSGHVDVNADMTNFDNAMNALPKKAANKMRGAVQALEAQFAKVKLDLKIASDKADLAEVQRLLPIYGNLEKKIEAVKRVATQQAKAIQDAARESQAAAAAAALQLEHEVQVRREAAQAARDQARAAKQAAQELAAHHAQNASKAAANGRGMNNIWLDDQMVQGKFSNVSNPAKKAGNDVRQAGSNGAMGLMLLSQTIDDAQYGFRAIVNNIPQVGAALATAFGASTEGAMKFGGALGIAAVAINIWIQNADHLKSAFREIIDSEDFKELTDQLGDLRDTAYSAFGSLVNSATGGGIGWVSISKKEIEETNKALEQQKKAKEDIEKAKKQNASTVAGVKSKEESEQGSAFRDAIQAYGGGTKLATDLYVSRRATTDFAGMNTEKRVKTEQQIQDRVNADIKVALDGRADVIKSLGAENKQLGDLVKQHAPGAAQKRAEADQKRQAEAGKIANSLRESVGIDLLKNPKMSDLDATKAVMSAMTSAGFSEKESGSLVGSVLADLKKSLTEQVRSRGLSEGLTEDQARQRIIDEAAERKKKQADALTRKDETSLDNEAGRLANSMSNTVGRSRLLDTASVSENALKEDIKQALEKAGMGAERIGELVDRVATKLKEQTDEAIQKRALEQGITQEEAKAQLSKESREQLMKSKGADTSATGTFMNGADALANSLQVRATAEDIRRAQESENRIPAEQLKEQKTTNSKLDDMIDNMTKGTTVFGRYA